jgi:PAS domain S-box-containing protein
MGYGKSDTEEDNSESNIKKTYIPQNFFKELFLVMMGVFFIMFIYEFFKTYFLPTLSIWGSHLITIIFSTVLATFAAYIILKRRNELLVEVTEKRDGYKLALEKVEVSEKKYRRIVENVIDAYFGGDREGKIIMASPSAANMFGYGSPDEMIGIHVSNLYKNPEDRQNVLSKINKHGKLENFEVEGLKKDGVSFWVSMNAQYHYDDHGQIQGTESFLRDITQIKKTEKNLKKSEIKYRTIFENTGTAIAIIDEDTTISLINSEFEKLSGFSKEEVECKKSWMDMVHKEDLKMMEAYHKLRRNTSGLVPEKYEFRFVDKNKNIKNIFSVVTVFPGTKKSLASLLDITDRKKAENKVLESEERNLRLLRESFGACIIHSGEVIVAGNSMALDIMGGETIEDFIGKPIMEFVHPDYKDAVSKRAIMMYKNGGTVPLMEEKWLKLDGTPLDVESVATSFTYNGKTAVQVVFRDITQRKTAEGILKKSISEKEMLLKEIHHRVKNNLMVISSLLNLQSHFVTDKKYLDIFKESQNRAKSMALIHEKLYRSTDLKRINFGEYIRTLSIDLFNSYVYDNSPITLDLNVDELMLDINTAVPLGLIVNELVSNSLKHAFPNGREGKISIGFHQMNDKFLLMVKDDGIGFPDDLDFRNTGSLGLQLVNGLTDQIDGKLELDKSEGTSFKIIFKEMKM